MSHIFGSWSSIYKRFNAWSASGKWHRLFHILLTDNDMERVFIDGIYAKVHQHRIGAVGGKDEAIGKAVQATPEKLTWAYMLADCLLSSKLPEIKSKIALRNLR